MATLTEVIDGCKTSPNRAIRWTACQCGGKLEICTKQGVTEYSIRPIPTQWNGVALRFSKPDGEAYSTFLGDNPRDDQCDCAGFCYGRGKRCRHLEAAHALKANRWLAQLMREVPADPVQTEAEIDAMAAYHGAE
jgi:hypothetical protein